MNINDNGALNDEEALAEGGNSSGSDIYNAAHNYGEAVESSNVPEVSTRSTEGGSRVYSNYASAQGNLNPGIEVRYMVDVPDHRNSKEDFSGKNSISSDLNSLSGPCNVSSHAKKESEKEDPYQSPKRPDVNNVELIDHDKTKTTVTVTTYQYYYAKCDDLNEKFCRAKQMRSKNNFTSAEEIYHEILRRDKTLTGMTEKENKFIDAQATYCIGLCISKKARSLQDQMNAYKKFQQAMQMLKGSLREPQRLDLVAKIYYYYGYILPKLAPYQLNYDPSERDKLTKEQEEKYLDSVMFLDKSIILRKNLITSLTKDLFRTTKYTLKQIPFEQAIIPKAHKEKLRKVWKKKEIKLYRMKHAKKSEYSAYLNCFMTINKRAKFLYEVAKKKGQILRLSKENQNYADQYMRVKYGFRGISDDFRDDEGIEARSSGKNRIPIKKVLGSLIQSTKEISACKTELGKSYRKLREFEKGHIQLKEAARIQYELCMAEGALKTQTSIQIIYIHMADAKKDQGKWNDVLEILKEFLTNFADPNNPKMDPSHFETYVRLVDAYAALNDYSRAAKYCKAIVKAIESAFGKDNVNAQKFKEKAKIYADLAEANKAKSAEPSKTRK